MPSSGRMSGATAISIVQNALNGHSAKSSGQQFDDRYLAHRNKSQSPEFTVGIDAKRTFVDKRSRPNLQGMTPADISWIEIPQCSSLLPLLCVLSFCRTEASDSETTRVHRAARRRAAAWPLAARAQQAEQVRRIGVLAPGSNSDPDQQFQNSRCSTGHAAEWAGRMGVMFGSIFAWLLGMPSDFEPMPQS